MPAAHGTHYEFRGRCLSMTTEHFDETALPMPGGVGARAQLNHTNHLTRHGIVQGWTTAGGKPVAIVAQRSTFHHDMDSVVGFLDCCSSAAPATRTQHAAGAAAPDSSGLRASRCMNGR